MNNIGYEICYTARKIYQYMTFYFEKYNITPEQFVILKTLSEEEGISQKEISLKVDKDQNTVKAIIDKLEKKNLIKRKINSNDKRAFSLFLTEEALETISKIEKLELEISNSLTQNINKKKQDIFSEMLQIIRQNISNNIKEK